MTDLARKKANRVDSRFAFFLDSFSEAAWGTVRNFLDGDLHHVLGLRAFRAVGHFEFNFLSLDQSFISIA
jgi:hypothetical protein